MAKHKRTAKKKTTSRRRKGIASQKVKLPILGSVPIASIGIGFAADRFGTQVSEWVFNLTENKYARAAAASPEYLVPLVLGYFMRKPDIMAYGVGGLGSVVFSVATAD